MFFQSFLARVLAAVVVVVLAINLSGCAGGRSAQLDTSRPEVVSWHDANATLIGRSISPGELAEASYLQAQAECLRRNCQPGQMAMRGLLANPAWPVNEADPTTVKIFTGANHEPRPDESVTDQYLLAPGREKVIFLPVGEFTVVMEKNGKRLRRFSYVVDKNPGDNRWEGRRYDFIINTKR